MAILATNLKKNAMEFYLEDTSTGKHLIYFYEMGICRSYGPHVNVMDMNLDHQSRLSDCRFHQRCAHPDKHPTNRIRIMML